MNQSSDSLAAALRDHADNLVLMDAVDSTHALALRLLQQMDDEGLDLGSTVIVATRQDQGQGRGGRRWISPAGGLYLSWMRSGVDTDTVARLPMLAAAAAHGAVRAIGLESVTIKWPNDLLVDGAKLAGLLVHARHSDSVWVTVGLGMNIRQSPRVTEPGALPATAIDDHLPAGGANRRREILACDFVARLSSALTDPQPALDAWRSQLVHRVGDEMKVRLASGEVANGRLLGFTADGFLRLRSGNGERTITGGDLVETG